MEQSDLREPRLLVEVSDEVTEIFRSRIRLGVSEFELTQLVSHSNIDPMIQKFTPRDLQRFPNLLSAQVYFSTRNVYTLTDPNDFLKGVVWFNPHVHPLDPSENDFTYAIRMYDPFRGKNLAGSFSDFSVRHFLSEHFESRIWLGVDDINERAIAFYEKTGWVHDGVTYNEKRDMGRNVMSFALAD